MAVSLDIRIFADCAQAVAAHDELRPGLCCVNIYDDGRGSRYYEATDKFILIRKREKIPDGEEPLPEPIRVLPQKKYIRGDGLIERFVPAREDIIKVDYPSFDGVLPRTDWEHECDPSALRPWLSDRIFGIITKHWRLDISKFRMKSALDAYNFFGGMIYYREGDTQACAMLRLPTKTIDAPALEKTEKSPDGTKHIMAGLEFKMDATSHFKDAGEIFAAIKKLMLEKGFDGDNAAGLGEVLKELGLSLSEPGARKKSAGKYIPPSSSFEEFRDNVDRDRKMLGQYLIADNLKIAWGVSKTRINSLAEVFTELYISTKSDSLESFMAKLGGLFSEAQLESIMRGKAYITPAAFRYIGLLADFSITPLKLSKLNMDVIKSEPAARGIDVDMKLLGELTRGAARMRAHMRRETRRIYNLEKRQARRDSGEYENRYGNATSITPAERESRDRTRDKRRAKNELGKKICPAVMMFMDLKKSRSYTIEKTIYDLTTINGKRYLRLWVDKENGEYPDLEGEWLYKRVSWKMKRVYVKYHHSSSAEAAKIHCEFPNHGKNPLKIKSRCPALIKQDWSLCPFVKNIKYIYEKDFGTCEMENFLQMFRGEAEQTLQHYIDKIIGNGR
ncbi:MAG: hypothetical protein LBH81_03835 [Rickettsiales bacterium]|nr:hypothetical protein [Rickettsiales bacterium]